MKKIAIILAGGVGQRTMNTIPKQFIEINGKPLIVYTLEKFNGNENIHSICISCHKDWIDYLWEVIYKYNITKVNNIIPGGANGLSSAYNGIKKISEYASDEDLVLIHDAVRPFVDDDIINNNIKVAIENELAMSAISLVETLAYSEDGTYSNKVVSRDNLYRIQTPQTFKLFILKNLYSNIDIENSSEPSTFALYMKKGLPIYISKGSEKNIKITYPEDIKYFKNFFNN